jgi:hypothetical protein
MSRLLCWFGVHAWVTIPAYWTISGRTFVPEHKFCLLCPAYWERRPFGWPL